MQVLSVLLWSAVLLSLTMGAAWLLAMQVKNGGWADTFWTFGIGGAAVSSILLFATPFFSARHVLVLGLVVCWSLRLGFYLYGRTRGQSEDARYAHLRQEWQSKFPQRLFLFLQIQALVALPLVLSICSAAGRPGPLDRYDLFGAGLFFVGLLGTSVSDWQLANFRSNPLKKGHICNTGLWKMSRHPNYFFEWITWWSWPLLAMSSSLDYPMGLIAIAAPLLMYYLLVHVSGLPLLEAHMERTRGEDFVRYKKETPIFFPRVRNLSFLPPKG